MLRFQHIDHLLVLGLFPLFVILFVWLVFWRKNKLKKLGEERLISEQIRGYISGRNALKFILLSIAFITTAVGWANLQKGSKTEKVQRKGVDVVIALDVSKSMLAKDIQPDRLTRAKQLVMRMVDKMQNDRVALVVFAGRAYLQVPLTIDYSAMKMMLQNVNPGLIPTQGTVIGEAVDMSLQSFSKRERKYKSLIIISDGESHDEDAVAKVHAATEQGVITHTVGIGSPQGTTLYDPETRSVKLDENGNPVVSKLNEEALRMISKAGNGTYTLLRNTDDAADKLTDAIASMEQKSLGAVMFTDYNSYFQYFLIIGFIALMIEWLLPGARLKMKAKTT